MISSFPDTELLSPEAAGRRRGRVFPWSTLLLCLAMAGMTVVASVLAGDWTRPGNDVLIVLGGNLPQGTLDHWGFWRLFAAKLQTGSWLGAVALLPFLWVASGAFERSHGRTAHLLLFVAASALSSTATIFFLHDERLVSVGCGGPALAMAFGALVAMARNAEGTAPWRSLRSWRALLVAPFLGLVALSLATGSGDPASLLAGVLVGLVAGLLLPTAAQASRGRGRSSAFMFGLAAAVVTTAGLLLAPRPGYTLTEDAEFRKLAASYAREMDGLNGRFDALVDGALAGELSRADLAARMRSDILPAWSSSQARWAGTLVNPALPDSGKLRAMQGYVTHRFTFLQATTRAWQDDDPTALIEAAAHKEAMEQARQAMAAPS